MTKTDGTNTVYYIYGAANQLNEIHQGNPSGPLLASFIYDYNGNLTSKTEGSTTTGLTWDALNRLTQVTKTGLATQSYVYDDQGRRISKTIGTTPTNYLYNGPDIAGEYGSIWSPVAQYTHGPNMDDPIIRATATQAQYFHQDGLGSVVGLSDQTGATTGTQRFDAWGNKLASTGTIPLYGYTGREPDETGLMYYRVRYYDPTIGRFISRDPIGLQGGISLYAYVGNNPANRVDPDGTLAFFWHGGIEYSAARNAGYGVIDSIKLAWHAMAADFGTQKTDPQDTVIHAMAGTFPNHPSSQTPEQSIRAAQDFIVYNSQPDNFKNLGTAGHTAQDLATPGHAGEQWRPQGSWYEKIWAYVNHYVGDIIPSLSTIKQAYESTKEVFANAQTGPTNVSGDFDIKKPEYGYNPEFDPKASSSSLPALSDPTSQAPYSGSQTSGYNPRGGK